MADIHTIPLHIGDLIQDTYHLSATEFGAYVRLIVAHYRYGPSGVPNDDALLRKLSGCTGRQWDQVRGTVLSFFALDAEWCKHKKVLQVLEKIQAKQRQCRDKALKRWNTADAAAPAGHGHGNADAMQSISHKPLSKKVRAKALTYTALFEEFWRLCPRTNCSKAEAFPPYKKAVAAGTPHEALAAGMTRYADFLRKSGSPAKHATTWLNGHGWDVDYDAALAQRTLMRPPDGRAAPPPRPKTTAVTL